MAVLQNPLSASRWLIFLLLKSTVLVVQYSLNVLLRINSFVEGVRAELKKLFHLKAYRYGRVKVANVVALNRSKA